MTKEDLLEYMIQKELIINSSWNGDSDYEIVEDNRSMDLAKDLLEDMQELGETKEQYFRNGDIFDISN